MWIVRQAFSAVGVTGALNFLQPDGGGIVEVRITDAIEIEQMSATSWKATLGIEELIA
jgi:hypothetical protein